MEHCMGKGFVSYDFCNGQRGQRYTCIRQGGFYRHFKYHQHKSHGRFPAYPLEAPDCIGKSRPIWFFLSLFFPVFLYFFFPCHVNHSLPVYVTLFIHKKSNSCINCLCQYTNCVTVQPCGNDCAIVSAWLNCCRIADR